MKTLIVDNYDSFVYNLVQYVGELGSKPVVYRNDQISLMKARKLKPDNIIISPGPGTPTDKRYFGSCSEIITVLGRKVPLLGVCLGHQGIFAAFGGRITQAGRLMHGKTSLIRHDGTGVLRGVENPLEATRYHSLACDAKTVPEVLLVNAKSTDDHEIMGIRHASYPIHGVQFHPESVLTREGKKIIKNFLEIK